MESTTQHRRIVLVAVLAAGFLISGCGGSQDPANAPEVAASTPEPEVTEPSPEPTPTELEADKKTQKLAAAGILRAEDFGPGWKEYSEGSIPSPEEWETTCVHSAGGLPDDLETGALQTGPTMELKKGTAFSTSFSYALPSVRAARRLIDAVNSKEWVECKRQELLEFLEGQDLAKTKVVVDPMKNQALGQSGFESQTVFLYKDKGEVTAVNDLSFYRLGRVVILVNDELGYNKDAQREAFDAGVYRALTKAYARVDAAL